MVERSVFARKLGQLPVEALVYADETTFDIWTPPSRTWQGPDAKVVIPMNQKHLKNITVFGAMGLVLEKPVYHLAKSTN